ncbi:MAG: hypothetical protein Q4F01_05160 [Staphylococcus rostri]|nr:hypothetical protein [Staphylococcus rostri]MDO5375559.1 hypothetical protein [Staphylococcus rostri]
MIEKDRGTITLNKSEAVIFANEKFKPFNNMIKKESSKPNPLKNCK